jgi:DNA polymerase III subunit gamma/tau
MSLYVKHRPAGFEGVLGNESVVQAIETLITKEDAPHSYLLTGPTGCGKTTIGRIMVKTLGCAGMDFMEIDSADFRGIDTIRDIRRQAQFAPMESKCRVWLLDECHKMSGDAQSALLKILEDTPSHVYFILCTTDPQKLLPTIKGRCSQFQVNTLQESQIISLLRRVVKAEGETLQKAVYEQIAQDSQGHPRNALTILEQVLSVEEGQRLQMAQQAAVTQSQAIELCRALFENTPSWKKVSGILSGLAGQDPESIRRMVLAYCNSVLLKSDNPKAGLVMEMFIEPFYNTGFPGLTYACYSVVTA